MAYELVEQLGAVPGAIVYPTGGGTGLVGMWKAFDELEAAGWIDSRRPRMYSVQAEGCAPIVRAFQQGADESRSLERCAHRGLGLARALGPRRPPDVARAARIGRRRGRRVGNGDARCDGAYAAARRHRRGEEGGAALAALELLLRKRGDVRRPRRPLQYGQRAEVRAAMRLVPGDAASDRAQRRSIYIWLLCNGKLQRQLLAGRRTAHSSASSSSTASGGASSAGAFEHGGYLHIALQHVRALSSRHVRRNHRAAAGACSRSYFIAMLGSGLAVTYFQPDAVTVGASGAIFGLFGALVAIGLRLGKDGAR